MTKKYNNFANIMLILAAIYTVVMIPLSIYGFYRVFGDIDFETFGRWYGDKAALAISITAFRIILSLAELVIWGMWIYFIAWDKPSIRVPIMITFIYYVAEIAYCILNIMAQAGDFADVIGQQLFNIFIMAGWLVLVIKDDATHRLVFTIIRSLALGITLMMDIHQIVRLILNKIKYGSVFYASDYLIYAEALFRVFVIALFIIWIIRPKVFLRSSGQEEK